MSVLWVRAADQPDYISHKDLAQMYSGDYDVPMHRVRREMNDEYHWAVQEHQGCTHCGGLHYHGVHEADIKHGGPDAYIEHLKKDIAANGINEPLEIRGGNVVTEGHHRALAAMDLRMDKIPVRHLR